MFSLNKELKLQKNINFLFYISHQQNYFALQILQWWNPEQDTKTRHLAKSLLEVNN